MPVDTLDFLASFHDRNPGVTPRAFARGRGPDGRSSYDRLVDHAHPGEQVLDLCCGDGFLLRKLLDRGANAVGVDMSFGELGAAAGLPVHRGFAQDLLLPTAWFDLVTCHLAFMLLDPVEPVIAEVRRVLRPGGRFVAIVAGGLVDPTDACGRFVARLVTFPELDGALGLGDRRAYSADGLRALLPGAEVERFDLDLSGTPDEVWASLSTVYDADLLDSASFDRLRDETLADLATDTRCGMVMWKVEWEP